MKILISTLGSRGDVQPYLALAVGLQRAGHRVTLATSQSFSAWIQVYGVETHPIRANVQEFMQSPETRAILQSGNFFRQFKMMQEAVRQSASAVADTWQAVPEADFVVQAGTGSGALEAAQLRGVPVALTYLIPFAPTRAFPSFFLSQRGSLGPLYNRLTHTLMQRVMWDGMGAPMVNGWRKQIGLRPWRSYAEQRTYAQSAGVPALYAYSPSVLPKPPDWDTDQHVVGYWFLDPLPDWQPPAALVQFLESGPPPVYVGFGSLSNVDPEHLTRLVLRALELAGQRGVLLTGWGGLMRLAAPPNVLFVDDVPHAWLFPRTVAVVHHGGAGSTGAGLRAGVPSLITPFAGDQCAWAERVAALGVGPRLPQSKGLTAEKLAATIHTAVNDAALRARAAALGAQIRAEDGVGQAVALLEREAARKRGAHTQ